MYTGRSSLISAGVFYIQVGQFHHQRHRNHNDIPDNDGVVRRPVVINTIGRGTRRHPEGC
jgi:hypothetical protein